MRHSCFYLQLKALMLSSFLLASTVVCISLFVATKYSCTRFDDLYERSYYRFSGCDYPEHLYDDGRAISSISKNNGLG
jgi:hypothetical protein